jgi:hypothetical protein
MLFSLLKLLPTGALAKRSGGRFSQRDRWFDSRRSTQNLRHDTNRGKNEHTARNRTCDLLIAKPITIDKGLCETHKVMKSSDWCTVRPERGSVHSPQKSTERYNMSHVGFHCWSSACTLLLRTGNNHRARNAREDQRTPSANNAIMNETERTRRSLQHIPGSVTGKGYIVESR